MENIIQLIIKLTFLPGIGPMTVRKYLQITDRSDWGSYQSLRETNISAIRDCFTAISERKWLELSERANEEISITRNSNVRILSFEDPSYPVNLKVLKNFPLLLYVKGNIECLNESKTVAVIGTRHPTPFGEKMGRRISYQLAEDGYVIVGGLAVGIDSCGHQGALEAHGKTVAILAAGLNMPVYPKINRRLANEIIEQGGALVSTYANGVRLRPQFLAARDEWQSGMSDGVIAVETGIKGGTNIAIHHSFTQKRPLGVLDHSAFFDENHLAEVTQAQGNKRYLCEKKACAINNYESLREFEHKMMVQRKKRLDQFKIDLSRTSMRKKYASSKQIDLF